MYNAPIPVRDVPVGSFLFLGDDPLLDQDRHLEIFCEPARVLALHPGRELDEAKFTAAGHTIVHAAGFDQATSRELSVEIAPACGGSALIRFPEDRHVVLGINLPGLSSSGIEEDDRQIPELRIGLENRTRDAALPVMTNKSAWLRATWSRVRGSVGKRR